MPSLFVLFLFLFPVLAGAQQYRMFWVDIWNPGLRTTAEADRMLAAMASSNANAILLEVRAEGCSFFAHSIEPQPNRGWTYENGFDALAYITAKAHKMGIEVHAWVPVTPLWNPARGYMPSAPEHKWHKHGQHASGKDLWITATESGHKGAPNGGIVDLGHPGAAEHVADAILEPLRHYDIDGIHLDYIRYPYAVDLTNDGKWNPEFYGWNPTAVERFNRASDRSGSPAQNDPLWQNWRRAQVTNFVRQVFLRAREIKPRVKVSAAVVVWGAPPSGETFEKTEPYQVGFQDWHSWLQEGIIDFVAPMLYRKEQNPADKANFDAWLNWFASHRHSRQIIPGVGVYTNSIGSSASQIHRVLGHPALFNGVALFSYATTNNEKAPAETLFGTMPGLWPGMAQPLALSWLKEAESGNVLGKAMADGSREALDGAVVELRSGEDNRVVRTGSTDGTGFYGFAGVPTGTYSVGIMRNGTEIFRSAKAEIANGQSRRFDAVPVEYELIFNLSEVAGAQRVRVTVSRPDGSRHDSVLCSSSPCLLSLYNALPGYSVLVEYLDESNVVRGQREMKPFVRRGPRRD